MTIEPAGFPPAPSLSPGAALALLQEGDLEVVGRLVVSSNNALLCVVHGSGGGPNGEIVAPTVYKPVAGERPLHDFPDGTLAGREVAAFALSEAAGLSIVPPTVLRDGPFGPGMVQLWIDPDETVDRIRLVTDCDPHLRPIALFDAVANNADRKVGHLLPMPDGHVYGVDHGICFHEEAKLRTVLWGWRGRPFDDAERTMLGRIRAALDADLGRELSSLLVDSEIEATAARVDALCERGRFPFPALDRPAIPWPPY